VKNVGLGLSAVSILSGLFGILAPLLAWLALAVGLVTATQRGEAVEVASALSLLGSYGLAIAVVTSSPFGLVFGVFGAGIARAGGSTVIPGLVGVALSLLAPVTWALTWAGLIGGVLYLFQDFHW
jgi:hypothetical protein